MADRRLWYVWPNSYRVLMIRRAARRTTLDNPVVLFPQSPRAPKSMLGRIRHHWWERVHDVVASSTVVENGKAQRVRLMREDDYKATYGPLISLVSEKCNNDNSIDVALGREMEEHRFVIALTFEKLHNRRARHLRAMVMLEETLRGLPRTARGSTGAQDPLSHAAGDRPPICRKPNCFGIVKIWRPKLSVVTMPAIDKAMRFEPDRAAQ